MMAGLAYMTGPPGKPLRAGASVNDIMGGMFGAIGAIAALFDRGRTGAGRRIDSGLFENCVLLMAQHMMQYAVTGRPAAPMPARVSAWGIYDVFALGDGNAAVPRRRQRLAVAFVLQRAARGPTGRATSGSPPTRCASRRGRG